MGIFAAKEVCNVFVQHKKEKLFKPILPEMVLKGLIAGAKEIRLKSLVSSDQDFGERIEGSDLILHIHIQIYF